MNKIILGSDIDRVKWDSLVEKYQGPGKFFHFSWYLDAVCPAWMAFVHGDYEAIFPIVSQSKYSLSLFVQPIFTREFNVIGVPSSLATISELTRELLRHRFVYFGSSTDFRQSDWKVSSRKYQGVELGMKYENLYKNYSQNIKRTLKKAKECELEIKELDDPLALIELFRNEKGKLFKHLGIKEYDAIHKLMINGREARCAHQLSAYLDGELIASSFYFRTDSSILFLKGAVNEKGKAIGAMVAIHNHVLESHCESHDYFDFGGSDDKGLREFNLKFGAIDVNYLLLSSNRIPWPLKSWVDKKYHINA